MYLFGQKKQQPKDQTGIKNTTAVSPGGTDRLVGEADNELDYAVNCPRNGDDNAGNRRRVLAEHPHCYGDNGRPEDGGEETGERQDPDAVLSQRETCRQQQDDADDRYLQAAQVADLFDPPAADQAGQGKEDVE